MPDAPSPSTGAVPWYVVHSKPHRESVAELHLRRKGFEVFYPKLGLPPYAPAPRRPVSLFPGYLFTRIDLATQLYEVAWTPGVNRLVGTGGVPTAIDSEVVAFLQRNAGLDGCLRARPDLRRGQEVEIAGGPFAGLTAIIENPPDAQGRVRVLMRLLNRRPVTVRMSVQCIKSRWIA
jgi:transcriptional antiterminator RfaH